MRDCSNLIGQHIATSLLMNLVFIFYLMETPHGNIEENGWLLGKFVYCSRGNRSASFGSLCVVALYNSASGPATKNSKAPLDSQGFVDYIYVKIASSHARLNFRLICL